MIELAQGRIRTLVQKCASPLAFQSQTMILKWEHEPAARSNERNLDFSPDLVTRRIITVRHT